MVKEKVWARDKFKVGDLVKRKDGENFGDGNPFNIIREPNLDETYESPNIVWVKCGFISVSHIEPTLGSLKDWDAKVGDIFVYHKGNSHEPSGVPRTITKFDGETYYAKDLWGGYATRLTDLPYWSLVERVKEVIAEQTAETKPDGGPAHYYDAPFHQFVTVNDMIDWYSEEHWGWRSYIFKDIIKACTRFGKKSGTDEAYDAKKIIYYGARLLMSVTDKATTREYLQQLLDDKQFKENEQ